MVPGWEARGLVAKNTQIATRTSGQDQSEVRGVRRERERAGGGGWKEGERGRERERGRTTEHDSSGLDDVLTLPDHANDGSGGRHPLDCKRSKITR
jgi:hypothetical protein